MTSDVVIRLREQNLNHVEPKLEAIAECDYQARLDQLQSESLAIQVAYFQQNLRAVLVFEGWDTAGKGGNISRFTAKLDPRSFRVHMVGAPYPQHQAKHYLYRFWTNLPKPGRMSIFDRSWYGRVLVERVKGLCRESDWRRAYREINDFERMLVDDGIRVIKIFLHISKKEQYSRLYKRYQDPDKVWKLTIEDFDNHLNWDQYYEATQEMLYKTNDPVPWHVVGANRKKPARLATIEAINDLLRENVDVSPPKLSSKVAEVAEEFFRSSGTP